MQNLNRDHADKIAKKLKARKHQGSAHEIAVIEYDGKYITEFGLRRGSKKDQGHGHVPASIYLSLRDALALAQCSLSYEDWVQRMKDKGVIKEEPDSPSRN
jgi:hypothetical protein